MKIKNIKVNNFRSLYDFNIDLEKDLSIIVGKNNTGKTSLLTVMDKFLGEHNKPFVYHDFNKEYFSSNLPFGNEKNLPIDRLSEEEYISLYISMDLIIVYDKEDYIGNLSKFFMSLSPKSMQVKLRFEYIMDYLSYVRLIDDYTKYLSKKRKNPRSIKEYFADNISKYFSVIIKTISEDGLDYSIVKNKADINKVISYKYIQAIRDVNDDSSTKTKIKTLSKLAQQYYKIRKDIEVDETLLDDKLRKLDKELNDNYKVIFKDVISDIDKFTDITTETKISIRSVLEGGILLKEASQVAYDKAKEYLPEEYNGLGYLNLFAMIFNINIQVDEFRKLGDAKSRPSDINLLYIEEPEVHTHPQMQYAFIKNIKDKITEGGKGKADEEEINLQIVVSSHSAHIVSQSDFRKIKYFYCNTDKVYSKNLSNLKLKMKKKDDPDENRFKFLKRYLTIERAELFFCDKAILIEGDTERILINAMMKKIDNENLKNTEYTPLLSQNISVVEVGAYSHVFDELIDFLEIKTLIITDIDTVDASNGSSCKVDSGTHTSNASIKHYFNNKSLKDLIGYSWENKIISKNTGKWKRLKTGNMMIAYQSKEDGYYARSFEDAFISLNYDFLYQYKSDFQGLKCRADITKEDNSKYYEIAGHCINSKGIFASDIIYYSNEDFTNWNIPAYIKDGLLWLQK